MDRLNSILNKYRIILYRCDIDEDIASKVGEEVFYNNELSAYYVEDGFDCYNAFTGVSRGNYRLSHRVAILVGFLNPDKPIEALFEYIDELCREKYDTNVFKVNRDYLLKTIINAQNGLYDVTPEVKKYFWCGTYKNKGRLIKSSVILSHNNNSKAKKTFESIEKSVNILIEQGNKTNTFITLKDISDLSGLSKKTVEKVIGLFREDIDRYNYSNFSTTNYQSFIKSLNIGSIVGVIEKFMETLEVRMTQRGVADRANLHYNTVNNLWFEDEVQDSLDRYNIEKRKFLKNNLV